MGQMETGIISAFVSQGNQDRRGQSKGESPRFLMYPKVEIKNLCLRALLKQLFFTLKQTSCNANSKESRVMFFHQSGVPYSF